MIIVDDMVQSGGTLYNCAVELQKGGALLCLRFVHTPCFPSICGRWETVENPFFSSTSQTQTRP